MIINKTITCVLFLLIFYSTALFAEEEKEKKDPIFILEAGASITPYRKWAFPAWLQTGPQFIDYNSDSTRSTSYEANFRFLPASLSGGVSASTGDTVISRVDSILGFLGYKSTAVRVSKSTFRGSAHWSGPLTSDMKSDFDFNDKTRSIDLIYRNAFSGMQKHKDAHMEWFLGLGYTEVTMPVQVSTQLYSSVTHKTYYGVATYDENLKAKIYCILGGYDTMSGIMHHEGGAPAGLHFWGVSQDKIGGGRAIMSDSAARSIEELNGGRHMVGKTNVFAAYFETDSTLGLIWVPSFADGKVAFAAGYNLVGATISPWFKSGSVYVNDTTKVGSDVNGIYINHGIVLRVYAVW